jgi:hypothetical protein
MRLTTWVRRVAQGLLFAPAMLLAASAHATTYTGTIVLQPSVTPAQQLCTAGVIQVTDFPAQCNANGGVTAASCMGCAQPTSQDGVYSCRLIKRLSRRELLAAEAQRSAPRKRLREHHEVQKEEDPRDHAFDVRDRPV